MLAKINGLFRLTRDAELVYTQSNVAVLKLGLACSEKYKDQETQLFIDAVVFGKPAEIINQYAGRKGSQLFLSGKLQTESWKAQDGSNRSKISMTVEGFEFVGGGKETQHNRPAPQQQRQVYQPPVETIPQDNQSDHQVHPNQRSFEIPSNEIPF